MRNALLGLLGVVAAVADPFPNGGFEDAAPAWTIPRDGFGVLSEERAHGGRVALRVTDATTQGGSNIWSPTAPVAGPGVYRVSGWVYPISGSGLGVYTQLVDAAGQPLGDPRHLVALGGDQQQWQPFRADVMVRGDAGGLRLWLHSYQASQVAALVDDLELEKVRAMEGDLSADLSTVKQRLVARILESAPPTAVAARDLAAALRADGRWADVDYANRVNMAWAPIAHLSRLLTLTRGWCHPRSEARGESALLAAIWRAYDFWMKADPQSNNWWYNQIGAPGSLYQTMLLLDSELSPERRAAGLKILARGKLGMTGENLVWVAEVTIGRGCLAGEPWTVYEAFDRIAQEIKVSGGEGIQADRSFYQHGEQLYSGGYGKGFSTDCPRFAALAAGTAFAFPPERLDLLASYLLDGQQWMVRGPRFDYSAAGRELTRQGSGSSGSLIRACRDMLTLDPPRRAEFEAFLARLQSPGRQPEPALVGNRLFWRADLMGHHRPGWYASVRLTSARLLQTEVVNSENLLGRHLADGLNYLYLGGDEYHGIFPVWDWQQLPGTTCEQTGETRARNGQRGAREFAGGVSDGVYGLAAMDFARGSLTARKAWLFGDSGYLCLGAGLTAQGDKPVVTTLNQCRLNGPVTVADADADAGGQRTLPPGTHQLQAAVWVHHDGVGYLFPTPAAARLGNARQTGNWKRIGDHQSADEVAVDVFRLHLDHGAAPRDASYAYVVAPGPSAAELPALAAKPGFEVLANTPRLQAGRYQPAGLVGLAAYEAGAIELPGVPLLTVSRPCLVLLRQDGPELVVAAADPAHGTGTLDLEIGQALTGEGATAVAGGTRLRLALPEGLEAGRSVVVRLRPRVG